MFLSLSYPIGDRERERNSFFYWCLEKNVFYWLEKKEAISLSLFEY
jgi:hypothetical protein